MRVALANQFHAGDIIMSRAIIRAVRPLLVDRVALHLECKPKYQYLWADLGLPIIEHDADPEITRINLWFSDGGDLLGVTGMTYATHVTSYNRQARRHGLPELDVSAGVQEHPSLDMPDVLLNNPPGVLVENGPVLSGQKTHDLNALLPTLTKTFPKTVFYCTGKLPAGTTGAHVVDMSGKNLIEIAALSRRCTAMLSRLSGPFIATLNAHNVGRLKRLVHGQPIGCPIWDERDVEYFGRADTMLRRLGELLR